MRIENPGTGGVDRMGKIAERSTTSTPKAVRIDPATTTHVASPELEALLNAASQLPEVRQEVVDDVTRRLATGQTGNLTQTANALLKGPKSSLFVSGKRATDGFSASEHQLASVLTQLPAQRAEVVEEVSRKVDNGELSTPDAIARTAEVLLD